jgi:hypothetical protein
MGKKTNGHMIWLYSCRLCRSDAVRGNYMQSVGGGTVEKILVERKLQVMSRCRQQ